MEKCLFPYDGDMFITPGARVKITDDAEEDSPETQDETLVKSRHAGKEGKYIEDIVTQCQLRFAVIELADGTRVPIRKQYIDKLYSTGAQVRISGDAEEDSSETEDETLIKSRHAGEVGTYVEDIVTQCKLRFAVIELSDGERVLIRKKYIEPL
jgi:hypothetical protein